MPKAALSFLSFQRRFYTKGDDSITVTENELSYVIRKI